MGKKGDLTEGSLWKKIWIFSLPLMFTNMLQILFNMADVAVVGQFAGALALASVGSTTTLVTMFTTFLIGYASGINVLSALYYGAKDHRAVGKIVHTGFIVSLLIGVGFACIGFSFSDDILRFLGTKDELIGASCLYMKIFVLGMPALAMYNYGNAIFSSVGETKKPLMYMSFSGVVNIVLNLFFVIVCKIDVAGVALASILSQYLSAFLILRALLCTEDMIRLNLRELSLNKEYAIRILKIGIPSGMQNAIFQMANLFVQAGVNTFDAIMVAGNSAAANADALVFDVMTAFYTACGSFMGQNYGAGNAERVKKSYLISLFYSFASALVIGWGLAFFGRPFLSLFTTDPRVVDAGMKRLTIMGCTYCVSAFMDCTIAASRALRHSLVPMIFVFLGSCLFRLFWVQTVFAHYRTIPSLYSLYIFSWILTAILEIFYFVRIYKKEIARMPR